MNLKKFIGFPLLFEKAEFELTQNNLLQSKVNYKNKARKKENCYARFIFLLWINFVKSYFPFTIFFYVNSIFMEKLREK